MSPTVIDMIRNNSERESESLSVKSKESPRCLKSKECVHRLEILRVALQQGSTYKSKTQSEISKEQFFAETGPSVGSRRTKADG